MHDEHLIVPDWPAPATVRSLITTRQGGVGAAPYASFNLGDHVGDDPAAVARNRERLARNLPAPPCWLRQVHGTAVVDAAIAARLALIPVADGAFARHPGVVCAVLTADCLPVLLCDRAGSIVAVAHAGWRGLQAGILERVVEAMDVPGQRLLAYLGPAIGPQSFEVGAEVRQSFLEAHREAAAAFRPLPCDEGDAGTCPSGGHCRPGDGARQHTGGWLADLYLLARQSLWRLGIEDIHGGEYCTVRQASKFFSYRRDGVTGRMAALIWLGGE
ncbi:MAG: peptidoglycan editing factor PgeF [Candidatus Accumulibacter sp.]|uniref:peptidoglycan editing factor PgeF n=1 Tax=Accumulibacter sp. TaxID=2053492 RepID=UPI001A3E2657|nr:peptidoglycan editing factor PgeF [Accumulibacter sp.]MBL8393283.1 peptidoglycan editing factor PgeF [Accumulibacter sp.]